jgi:hypothetical protein
VSARGIGRGTACGAAMNGAGAALGALFSRLPRAAVVLVLAAALAAPLAACGKKADVKLPPGKTSEFPRTYPSE